MAGLAVAFLTGCRGPSEPARLKRKVKMPVFTEAELAAAEPLEVVSVTPSGLVEESAEASEVVVAFDAPMVALQAIPDTVDFPLLIEPDHAGTCHWLGTAALAFRPEVPFPSATEFRVRIPKGVKAVGGQMLKQDYEFSFSTARPRLERSYPHHEDTFIELDQPIYLVFNIPMDPTRAKRHIRLEEPMRPTSPHGARRGFQVRFLRQEERPEHWWFEPQDSARILVIVPLGGLRIQTRYRVVLEPGLSAREGNLGLEERRVVAFKTFNRFKFEGVPNSGRHHPEDMLEFKFTNPVPVSNLVKALSFRPPIRFPPQYEDQEYASVHSSLCLELRPETTYEVTISRWLKDQFGNRLGRDAKFKLKTISYRPDFGMPSGPGIVESDGKLFHPVWMVNVESIAVRMRRLEPAEVIRFWRQRYDRYYDEEYGSDNRADTASVFSPVGVSSTIERIWRPGLERNKRTILPLKLESGLGGRRSGYLFCELDWIHEPPHTGRYRRAFLQVTPYGLTAKFAPENGLCHVTMLRDASPASSVSVQVRDDENRLLWQSLTDRAGFVRFPGWKTLGIQARNEWSSPRVWLFVQGSGGDLGRTGQAFVHSTWGTGIYPYDFGISYDWRPDPNRPRGFIFTDKGLYRAGDTVRIKGMVRSKELGQWVIPAERGGTLVITDSRDETVLSERIGLSAWGNFDRSVSLKPDAPSGYYSMSCELGREQFHGSFRVEAYRPAEFEVDVKPDRNEYVAGDEFRATLSGRYLFGAPMAEDSVSWNVSLRPDRHSPPGHEGFRFGPSMDGSADDFRVIASGAGRLDGNGQTRVCARLDLSKGLRSCLVNCEATVVARNERTISGRESRVVHRAEFYIGVKPSGDFIETGDTLGFDIITTGPDGKLAPGKAVTATVFRRIWKSARKTRTHGRYSWVSEHYDEKVAAFKVKTQDQAVHRGAVHRVFKPQTPGYYWLKCESRDRRRNTVQTDCSFWVAGKGEAAWMMRDDDLIELVRDRESYKPGDTARILVKSPWTRVKALVTIEREMVLGHFTTEIEGNADLIRVPIEAGYLPNVFLSVVLLKGRTAEEEFDERGQDLGKPGFKIGYIELPVDPGSKRLDVLVRTDKQEYLPRETVNLRLRVRSAAGSGLRSEVALAVVDLGVLKLTGYATPNPFGVFYAPRPLSVATAETRLHLIGQRNYGEKGEAAAGDGPVRDGGWVGGEAYDFAYREKFLETALWLPAVRTDEAGNAEVSFELPDNLTTWQVIAVASTKDRFGSADARFKANKPLLIQPSLPRFVRPEDRLRAGVMVHNRTERELAVEVDASARAGLELVGESRRQVRVSPNQPAEVLFEYRCCGGTGAELQFRAASGPHRDALKLSLPVRNPPVTEAVAVYEQTADSAAIQWVTVPADAFSGIGGLELTAASSGLSGLERGLEYLRTYPYDCLEQRLSKVLPFITAEDVINTFNLSELKGRALREFVAAELGLVPRYQDESGGFRFWAEGNEWSRPSPYISAYCMYALALAKRNGYQVDERVVERGRAYLLTWLSSKKDQDADWPYSVDEQLTTVALGVYALALWNVNVDADINTLMERLDQLSVFGKAYLLKAVADAGYASSAGPRLANATDVRNRIVQALNNKLRIAPTTAHYEEEQQGGWAFHSNVRTTALVLQAMLEARHEFEYGEKVVKWLVSERKAGRWRTTQENVYVFDAFSTFYRTYEKARPDFAVTVKLAGQTVLQEVFSGRELATRRRFIPIDSLSRGERQPVNIVKLGPARLYYGLRLTTAAKGELRPAAEGMSIEKTTEPVKGKASGFGRGQQYLVTLKVNTTQDRLYVVIDDPLPAGFEIVNTSFATESQESRRTLGRARSADLGSRWWGEFDHEEIYDDRYLLFATYLSRGTHSKTYLVKALTPGRFLMPATKALEMYTPEVFGRTGQQWVEVK